MVILAEIKTSGWVQVDFRDTADRSGQWFGYGCGRANKKPS